MSSRSCSRELVEKYCSSLSSTSSTASNARRTRSIHSVAGRGDAEDGAVQTIRKPQGDEGDVCRRMRREGGISERLLVRSCSNIPILTSTNPSSPSQHHRPPLLSPL